MGARLASAPAVAAAYLYGWVAADGFLRARLPPRPASRSPSSPRAARRGAGVADRSEEGRMAMERGADKVPLSEVVTDCVRRWFQDTLKEAKAGDVGMQVLVGQMYCSGYGVARNEQKGKAWILKASQTRSSAVRVGDKHPVRAGGHRQGRNRARVGGLQRRPQYRRQPRLRREGLLPGRLQLRRRIQLSGEFELLLRLVVDGPPVDRINNHAGEEDVVG